MMQIIFVKHFLGCLDDCRSRLVDFDSPKTCSQFIFPCSKQKEEVKIVKISQSYLKHLHPTKKNWQWAGWSLMMWKVWLLASHSRTASSSRGKTGLSESRDRRVSTMSSSKGNCNWIFKRDMRDSLSFQFKLYYPTPGHLEEIAQLSIPNYFCSVAEINVVTTAVASQIEDVVEYLPTFHVVAPQLVINPHKPSFNIFYKGQFFFK